MTHTELRPVSILLADAIIKKKSSKLSGEADDSNTSSRVVEDTASEGFITTVEEEGSPNSTMLAQYEPLTEREVEVAEKMVQGYLARRKYRSLRKSCKARRKGLEELLQTEKDYISHLEILDKHLRLRILHEGIISEEEERKMFPNFVQFQELSKEVLQKLGQRYRRYHLHQTFGEILQKQAPFFAIYIEYMNSYEKTWNHILSLAHINPRVQVILDEFKLHTKQNNDANSYLIKPVQRLPRYKLLIIPILDKTDPEHKDYQLLKAAGLAFGKVASKVNDLMDRIIMNKKIQELDKEFSTDKHPILVNNRRLLFEEAVHWIHQGKILVNAYFFNDLILFINVEGEPKKIIHRLSWTEKSSIMSVSDGKTMTNVVNVSCPDGNATLECGQGYKGQETKTRVISNVKSKMTNKEQQKVIINALGTEELNSTSLSKHTIYIMEVRIGRFRQNLFIRFKELLEILVQLNKEYKHLNLPALQKKWFTSHKSNVIEERKVQILEILQTILNDTGIQKQPEFMISKLNLKEKFYQLPELIQERIDKEKPSFSDSKHNWTAFELLCATELQLGRYNFHGDEMYRESHGGQEYFIDVKTLTGDIHKIKITEFDTVEDVCNKVSKRIGLTMNRDFRLFHEIGKKESRVLDDDWVINKIFNMKEEKHANLIHRVRSTIVNAIIPDTKPILIFKKYSYLPFKTERHEYKRDLVRLKLWTFQILQEVKDMKYHLHTDEYFFYAATYLYAVREGEVEDILARQHVDIRLLKEMVLPEEILKIESISQDELQKKILNNLERLHQEISVLKSHNQNTSLSNLKKGVKTNLFLNKAYLCYQIIMNKISSNFLFSSNLFYIEIHKSLNNLLPTIRLSYNMWLAIKLEGVSLLKPFNKEPVFEIKYQDIASKTVHPSEIVFNMQDESKYRLGSYQSFEISQLIDYIKKLSEMIHITSKSELSREDAVQTSIYMSSLMRYRETYNS